jgi:chemotaxis protein MotA
MKKKGLKFDITVIAGIAVAWACVILCLVLEGNRLSAFVSLSSFLLVIGGSMGATMVGFKWQELLSISKSIVEVIRPPRIDFDAIVAEMRELAVQARREGVLSLEERINHQGDEFIKLGLQLVVDGADSEVVQKILETKALVMESSKKIGEKFFEAMGGYAPTLGIIGTVLGLVKVLGNLSEPEKLGEGIAAAFVATLYGISTANLIFLPLAARIRANNAQENLYYEMVQEGVLSIHAGDNPVMLEEKLKAFIEEKMPEKAARVRPVESEVQPVGEEGAVTV